MLMSAILVSLRQRRMEALCAYPLIHLQCHLQVKGSQSSILNSSLFFHMDENISENDPGQTRVFLTKITRFRKTIFPVWMEAKRNCYGFPFFEQWLSFCHSSIQFVCCSSSRVTMILSGYCLIKVLLACQLSLSTLSLLFYSNIFYFSYIFLLLKQYNDNGSFEMMILTVNKQERSSWLILGEQTE